MADDIKMEGKSLQDANVERFNQAAAVADTLTPDVSLKKPLKEEHFHKLYFFKTEHDKLVAQQQMLKQELQNYASTLIEQYFPGEKDAIISLEERSISRKSRIETPGTKLELPK